MFYPNLPGGSPQPPRWFTPTSQVAHPNLPGGSPQSPRWFTPTSQVAHPSLPGGSPQPPRWFLVYDRMISVPFCKELVLFIPEGAANAMKDVIQETGRKRKWGEWQHYDQKIKSAITRTIVTRKFLGITVASRCLRQQSKGCPEIDEFCILGATYKIRINIIAQFFNKSLTLKFAALSGFTVYGFKLHYSIDCRKF